MLPGENGATYEAYDGVELTLGGSVVRCPSLTVVEAVRYLRLFGRETLDVGGHAAFLAEFPKRIGILDTRLSDLGVEVEGLTLDRLTYTEGLWLVETLTKAEQADARDAAMLLNRFRVAVGFVGADPEAVFALGREFVDALYRAVYRLASQFVFPPELRPKEPDGASFERSALKLCVGLDDMMADHAAYFGGYPAPDSSWRLFLATLKRAPRYEARAHLAMYDAVRGGIDAALGGQSGAAMAKTARAALVRQAYPIDNAEPLFHENVFAPDYGGAADA